MGYKQKPYRLGAMSPGRHMEPLKLKRKFRGLAEGHLREMPYKSCCCLEAHAAEAGCVSFSCNANRRWWENRILGANVFAKTSQTDLWPGWMVRLLFWSHMCTVTVLNWAEATIQSGYTVTWQWLMRATRPRCSFAKEPPPRDKTASLSSVTCKRERF